MNANLGIPYEAIVKKAIERGYAGNQTEVIRQALLAYERMLEEEEVFLVHKAVEIEGREIDEGKVQTVTHEELKKRYGL